MQTRRNFFQILVGTGTAATGGFKENGLERILAATRNENSRSPEEAASDEDFWFDIQEAFVLDRTLVNLNNGGVSPCPRVVQDAVRRYAAARKARRNRPQNNFLSSASSEPG